MTEVQHAGADARRDGKPSRAKEARGRNTMTATLRAKGGITLPQAVREKLHLEEGDQVIVTERDGSIVLTPAAIIPRDQEWFWTPEWQAKEAEADAELARGEFERYDSDEEFLKALGSDD
ncbi:AbrB/MazE/SpoVT family DNA-binding domain-containing protein [Hamadaea sp. NPDC051192]|uniref:AbrB/MazE/SpoVT family DNA-binding domain-containing protein n=1 Tax=Hamadaea sp. NPDC051192 TaxID=3154940 RepID=UPI003443612B